MTFELALIPCQEVTGSAVTDEGDILLHCHRAGQTLVWHQKDRRAYVMCDQCSYHNIKNRGGIELVPKRTGHNFSPSNLDSTSCSRCGMHISEHVPAQEK